MLLAVKQHEIGICLTPMHAVCYTMCAMNSIFGAARKPKTCYTKDGAARKPKTCYTKDGAARKPKTCYTKDGAARKPSIAVEALTYC